MSWTRSFIAFSSSSPRAPGLTVPPDPLLDSQADSTTSLRLSRLTLAGFSDAWLIWTSPLRTLATLTWLYVRGPPPLGLHCGSRSGYLWSGSCMATRYAIPQKPQSTPRRSFTASRAHPPRCAYLVLAPRPRAHSESRTSPPPSYFPRPRKTLDNARRPLRKNTRECCKNPSRKNTRKRVETPRTKTSDNAKPLENTGKRKNPMHIDLDQVLFGLGVLRDGPRQVSLPSKIIISRTLPDSTLG